MCRFASAQTPDITATIFQSMLKFISALPLVLATAACTSMLPKANTDTSTFNSFEEARTAVKALVPMKSQRSALQTESFNPISHPNTKLLTHADVVRLYVPSALLKREDLDPGVLACLEARDACEGIEIVATKIARTRTGNFFADFSNFSRRTETSGWRFNAVILLVNDLVVYRSWGGQPSVKEVEITSNPLGPLQDVGPSLLSVR